MGSDSEPQIIYFMDEIVKTLRRDDDLVAVLRGQLHVEASLSKVLVAKYPGAIEVLNYVGYFEKIRLARKAGLIDAEMRRALQALGELRNSFAHLPVMHEITQEDEATFLANMPETIREGATTFVISGSGFAGIPTKTGQSTRTAIGMIYMFIAAENPEVASVNRTA